jgi:hypothetical protein
MQILISQEVQANLFFSQFCVSLKQFMWERVFESDGVCILQLYIVDDSNRNIFY